MFIDRSSIKKLSALCVLGSMLVFAGPASVPARAQDSEQEERAVATWATRTEQGRATYSVEVKRATVPGEGPVTTGFIATHVCPPTGKGEVKTCISAADLKRVSDGAFDMDPSMGSATFEMKLAGARHGAVWQAEPQPPQADVEGLAEGEASVERDAAAEGNAYGTDLPEASLDEALIERAATVGDSVPFPLTSAPETRAADSSGSSSSSSSSSCFSFKPEERGFTREMNAERSRRGFGKMRLDPELSRAARAHTKEMTSAALLHHTESDALRRRVTRWIILGENVGVGATVTTLHAAFMASPPHKANILFKRFRYVGVGTASSGSRLWVTVIFETKDNPGTRLRMRRC